MCWFPVSSLNFFSLAGKMPAGQPAGRRRYFFFFAAFFGAAFLAADFFAGALADLASALGASSTSSADLTFFGFGSFLGSSGR